MVVPRGWGFPTESTWGRSGGQMWRHLRTEARGRVGDLRAVAAAEPDLQLVHALGGEPAQVLRDALGAPTHGEVLDLEVGLPEVDGARGDPHVEGLRQAGRGALLADHGDRVGRAHGGWALGQPPVPEEGGAADRGLGRAADPDRGAARADRAGVEADLGPVGARGDVLVLERGADDRDRLGDLPAAGLEVDAERGELALDVAGAGAEDRPAAAEPVEGEEGLRGGERVAGRLPVHVAEQVTPIGERGEPS